MVRELSKTPTISSSRPDLKRNDERNTSKTLIISLTTPTFNVIATISMDNQIIPMRFGTYHWQQQSSSFHIPLKPIWPPNCIVWYILGIFQYKLELVVKFSFYQCVNHNLVLISIMNVMIIKCYWWLTHFLS